MRKHISQFNISTLSSEFFGGLSGAIAVLPQTLGLSVLLFTSLGMDASDGAMAGLMGAVILLLTSGFAGATVGMISAPNGPVTILLSGLVVKLAPEYPPNDILIILSMVLLFTGIFQILFGLLKGGEIVKLIPYPVVASMITAIGVLMIKSQVYQIIPSTEIDGWYKFIPLITASSTVGAIFLFKKYFPKMPAILMGLLSGIVIYSLLTLPVQHLNAQWVIGPLPAIKLGTIIHRFDGVALLSLPWEMIIISSLALAVLVMIDCLLTALVADTQTSMRHNAGKELVAQGVGQMLIGLVGGVGGGGTKGSTLANTMAGGRRWSPVFAALIILLMTLFGRGVGSLLPLSALSGVIIFIGLKMLNLNIMLWFKDKHTRVDAFNAVMVVLATLFFDVTKAVALGMAFAVITFIRRGIKRSLIRRQTNLIEYSSPRKRSKRHRLILAEHGEKALLIELQGDLYFARTDQLYRTIVEHLKGKLIIILHFRRVLSIDMSGMVILMQLVEIARKNGTEIVFTHLHKHLGFGRKMKRAFSAIESNKKSIGKIFHSSARALEYAEDLVLKTEYKDKEYRVSSPVDFENNDLFRGLGKAEIALLKKISFKSEYKSKETILAEGDKSSSLYLVTSGFVEQRIYNGHTSYKVLVKYSPGTYFGKLTFFKTGPVTTRFIALGDTTVYKIKRSDIEAESAKMDNRLVANFLFSIGRALSKESTKHISEIRRLEAL